MTASRGTTFYFVSVNNSEALTLARELAGGRDVRLGGGPATVRGFLADGLEGFERDFTVSVETTPSGTTHITFTKITGE